MFGISMTLKEVPENEKEILPFPSHVQRFLKEEFASTSNRCNLLINLDPYGDKVFGASEVKTKKPLIHSGFSLNGSL